MVSRLGHVGVYVSDLEASRHFYCDVLGLTVTDESPELGMVFLSARPEVEHHELLLCAGRDADADVAVIQQVSFRCDELADVVSQYERLLAEGTEIDMVVSHGNAIGVYFFDPDHNRCEVYWNTGLLARQPYLETVDLSRPVDDILADVAASVREHGNHGYLEEQAVSGMDLRS